MPDPDPPAIYQIRIRGHLGCEWADWFDGMVITRLPIVGSASGETLLTGRVIDQAALHSLLRKIRDLGMILLSISRIEPE